ncbi:MAG: LytTR family DNA-binding domain-containing protein, partial [Pseudomonadota bacterium]
ASLVILILILTVQYVLRAPVPLSFLATLYLYIILIVIVMAGFLFLLRSHLSRYSQRETESQRASATDVLDEGLAAFRGRLPRRFQSAEILAVSSDDHYVKVQTDRGDAIIRMRLADAIAHLASLDGQQVHRSWWVARSAVDHVTRDSSGLSLHLAQGQTVPVSRSRRAEVDAWLENRSSAV